MTKAYLYMVYRPRNLDSRLSQWMDSPTRRPLVLRGARQVGKSSLVRGFASNFDHYIELNLELEKDKRLFTTLPDAKKFVEAVQAIHGVDRKDGQSLLLFIDEIQQAPIAIQFLRYLYEKTPNVHVIAAGSLLEFALGKVKSMPVGRVEYIAVHPLSFEEYLIWTGRTSLQKALDRLPVQSLLHEEISEAFEEYMIIGGMPEVVDAKANGASPIELSRLHGIIWNTYMDDVERYGKNESERNVLRHILNTAAGVTDRFSFANFGGSNFRSREVSEALAALDKARVIRIVRPTKSLKPPIVPELRAKPRLQWLDVGLLNYSSGIGPETLFNGDLSDQYRGRMALQVVTQELIAQHEEYGYEPHFWIRENSNANAEVDLVTQMSLDLVPLEVKSGSHGRLRSLHQFVERTQSNLGIRIFNSELSIDRVTTPQGFDYQLLSIPLYGVGTLSRYIAFAKTKMVN